jgi:hypothetical protein
VGARFEGFATGGGHVDGENVSLGFGAGSAALGKGEFYFTQTSVRPFVGLGLGLYHFGSQSFGASPNGGGLSQDASSYFGMAPQLGLELGAFRLSASYNFLVGGEGVHQSAAGGPNGAMLDQSVGAAAGPSRNYLALELGIRFGGSKRPEPVNQETK